MEASTFAITQQDMDPSGGSAPYLNAQFIEWDLYWLISAYIIFLCICTVVATAIMKETRGHDLHRVGS